MIPMFVRAALAAVHWLAFGSPVVIRRERMRRPMRADVSRLVLAGSLTLTGRRKLEKVKKSWR